MKKNSLKENNTKSAAIVTIKNNGRTKIAQWLRRTANLLEEFGEELDGVFVDKYIYKVK